TVGLAVGGAIVGANVVGETVLGAPTEGGDAGAKFGRSEGVKVVAVLKGGEVMETGGDVGGGADVVVVVAMVGGDVAGIVASGLFCKALVSATVPLLSFDLPLSTTDKATTAPTTTASDKMIPTKNRRCRRCRIMVVRREMPLLVGGRE
ncbi:MAG: hypothetical protein SGARI_005962, partial [Bacillariaceae sp.]